MPDFTAIATGLASIKTALEITKGLREIDSSLKDSEVKLKLANLIETLVEIKLTLSEVKEENLELKESIKILESQLKQREELTFRDEHYYLKTPQDGKPNGPFCSKCYDDENKLITIITTKSSGRRVGKYRCPKCKVFY